jgi:hypothetical protein
MDWWVDWVYARLRHAVFGKEEKTLVLQLNRVVLR